MLNQLTPTTVRIIAISIAIVIIVISIAIHWKSTYTTNDKAYVIRTLMKQCARWAIAAEQDQSPIVTVLHANYAAGYLWALRDIATDDEIASVIGKDIIKFKDKIINIQETAAVNAVKICPQFMGNNDIFLSAIAGEG